ncbi:hypothetical protein DPMN_175178 [Dreissena polymorpha]|uniref:Uncharacterized protein n=1 Tax=Dreissena polymorpha TaxID=45954 RepID=A0A9D4IJB5_DREPO|nr:hypothetical protein DPMN_175178 [Dreissena polymorpha]
MIATKFDKYPPIQQGDLVGYPTRAAFGDTLSKLIDCVYRRGGAIEASCQRCVNLGGALFKNFQPVVRKMPVSFFVRRQTRLPGCKAIGPVNPRELLQILI